MDIPFPEPVSDLLAQYEAVLNGSKPAMYISPANYMKHIYLRGGYVARRSEGTILTFNSRVAKEFLNTPVITDDHMACWLGYPESKTEVTPYAKVVQARNNYDAVIMECATSNPEKTAKIFAKYGSKIVVLSISDALKRRMEILNGDV